MSRHVLLTTVLLTTWICLCAGQAYAQGRIAFQSKRDAQWEIYVMNADGSAQTNLTNHSSRDIDPTWSPDGSKIAFASDRRGKLQIFVMNADGTDQIQLTEQPGHHIRPAWSPDGAQIAFASDQEGDYDIYVMQADGSDMVNVTQHPSLDTSPTWSPDGTQLTFVSQRDRLDLRPQGNLDNVNFERLLPEPSDIFVMDALGGAATNLTISFAAKYNRAPSWAPIGDRILYVFARSTGEFVFDDDIVITQPAGGGRTSTGVGSFSNLRDPSWAPDGRRFTFASWSGASLELSGIDNDWEIYVATVSGGEPINLTQTPGSDGRPTWSPDLSNATDNTSVEGRGWGKIKAGYRRIEQIDQIAD